MASKSFNGKACAYCGKERSSTTAEHVIPRKAMFVEDRRALPKVPACGPCNNAKSKLEHYALAVLLVGTNHIEGNRYRAEMIRPRLAKDHRLAREVGLYQRPKLMKVNGIIQPMHIVHVDAHKINQLNEMIVKGLYFHHFGMPLDDDWRPEVQMMQPAREPAFMEALKHLFVDAEEVQAEIGRGAFWYEGVRSRAHPALTLWRFSWHGGVRLYGNGAPAEGIGVWWGVTRPAPEALAKIAKA